jgi:hypothetical protein
LKIILGLQNFRTQALTIKVATRCCIRASGHRMSVVALHDGRSCERMDANVVITRYNATSSVIAHVR